MSEGGLTCEHLQENSHPKNVLELKSSYQTLLNHQKTHRTLRATHLENIASALVQIKFPHIQESNRDNKVLQQLKKLKFRELQQLKQLKFREKVRNMHRKISNMLSPKTQLGIDRIDIPDSSVLGQNMGDPTQPKTWTGPWLTLHNPEKIAQVIKTANIAQYHQEYNTLFWIRSISGHFRKTRNNLLSTSTSSRRQNFSPHSTPIT
jgi:hypothetical protein